MNLRKMKSQEVLHLAFLVSFFPSFLSLTGNSLMNIRFWELPVMPLLNGRNGSPTRLLMDYSRNEGTDYIPSLSYSPSLAVVSSLALVFATFPFI